MTSHRGRLAAAMLTLALGLSVGQAAGAEQRFEFSGFGTLGAAATNESAAEFTRDQSQPKGIKKKVSGKVDSLIGLQGYFRATDDLDAVVQVVSRYGPEGNYRPELTWAFAKYALTPGVSLRGGRIGTDFFMLASSRLVGYSYLPVRPPITSFAPLPFHYLDGGDVTATTLFADGLLKASVFAGLGGEKAPIVDDFLSLRGNPLAGGYLDYQKGNWQWRATVAGMEFKHELPGAVATLRDGLHQAAAAGFPSAAGAAQELSLNGKQARFQSIGAVYDSGPLQVSGMLSEIRYQPSLYENSRAGYLLAGYRLGEVTPFAMYSWSRSKHRDLSTGLPGAVPAFATLNAGYAAALRRTHSNEDIWSIGGRWDFYRNLALKAQLDIIRGTADSIHFYPRNESSFDGKLNVFSLTLDFVF